jgi:hypothetical protein
MTAKRGLEKVMAIGVFGGTPELPGGETVLSTPLYWMYEWGNAARQPAPARAEPN